MDRGDLLWLASGAMFVAGAVLLFAGPSEMTRYAGLALALLAVVPLVLSRPFQA